MKVLLISVNNEKIPYPSAPIGAAYVATALRNKNHNVRILDLCFVEDDHPAIAESFKSLTPDIVGISIRNVDNLTYNQSIFYMPRVRRIVDLIKKYVSLPLIVGGSGFSIFPEEVLRYLDVNTGIIGEGENAFALLLDAINKNDDISSIPNLCYIKDGKYYSNGKSHVQFHILPDRSFLDNKKYLELSGMANIQSKRGCAFKCSYCTYPNIDGNIMRLREPTDVVRELKEMKTEYDIDHVFFVDDIFNFPEEHAVTICEEIIKNNLKINWTCFAIPKGMTTSLARLMKKAGCKGVEFGTDAGSEKTLRGLGKSFTTNDIAYATECCKNVDLPNAHYIIIGGPEEDISTVNETFTLFNKIKPTAAIALIGLRIYPNTLLRKRAVEEGVINKDTNLLEPVFYVTPNISIDTLFRKVSEHAKQMHNWIVPGLNIRYDVDMMRALRRMGNRGPLWNLLSLN